MKSFSQLNNLLELRQGEKLAWSGSTVDRVFPDFDNQEEIQDTMQIPLSPSMLKRLFPTKRDKVFHVVDPHHVKDLLDLQGTKKSISAFYNMDSHPITSGVNNRGGMVAELEGNILMANSEDVMSRPDESGRRYIGMDYFKNNPFWQEQLKEVQKDLTWEIKDILKKHTDNDEIDDLNFQELMNLWSDTGRESDGKTKNKLIKDYFDGVEKVFGNHVDKVQERMHGYMDDKTTTGSWDEMITNEIKVNKLHITNSALDTIKVYEPELVDQIMSSLKDHKVEHQMHDGAKNLSKFASEESKKSKPKTVEQKVKPSKKEPKQDNAYVGASYHDKPVSDSDHHKMQHDIYQIKQDEEGIRNFVQLHRGIVWQTKKGTWGALRSDDHHGHMSRDESKHVPHGGSYFKDKAHAIAYVNGVDNKEKKLNSDPKHHNDHETTHWSSFTHKTTRDED